MTEPPQDDICQSDNSFQASNLAKDFTARATHQNSSIENKSTASTQMNGLNPMPPSRNDLPPSNREQTAQMPYIPRMSYNPYGYNSPYGGYGSPYYRGASMFPHETVDGVTSSSPSWTQGMAAGTLSAFRLLDQIVQTFTGFAQMLESTFHATYSSFWAMMGLADQFSYMRSYLTSALNLSAMIRTLQNLLRRLTGASFSSSSAAASTFVAEFINTPPLLTTDTLRRIPMSKKPFMIFLLMVIGVPYLIAKLIKLFERNEYAVALHKFQGEQPTDLSFPAGERLRILSRTDISTGQPLAWWLAEMGGRRGWIPSNFVKLETPEIPKPEQELQ